ncbi:MAG: hypothetical protein PHW88_05335 [Bacteroidales bacterium]|nr:hypothetical protein [Bacteroidales bacterium]
MWFHISVQGNGGQSIFHRQKDILHAIDLLGVFSHYHQVKVVAYQILSNHYHVILECLNPRNFIWGYRISYSRYYNSEYNSFGAVGRFKYSCGEIHDYDKLEKKLIYVFRNSTKHGVKQHPYSDPYNSAQYYFFKERNLSEPKGLKPAGCACELEHSTLFIPEHYLLDSKGHIYPRSFLKYDTVENVFKTYSNFIQKISNPTQQEIEENNGIVPKPKNVKTNDLALSEIILETIYPRSIISLTDTEKVLLCLKLKDNYPVSIRQFSRVLSIPESTLRWKISEILRKKV